MPANQRSGQMNSSRLLREIWLNQGISRIELSLRLELDKSTVTLLVNRMLDLGILETLSEGKSSPRGGRKPVALGIRGDFGYYLGLEVLPEGIRIVLMDLLGNMVQNHQHPFRVGSADIEKDLAPVIEEIYNSYSKEYPLLGLGIALSGIIDPFKGEVLQSMVLSVDSPLKLKEILQERIHCEILIENDANCCAWGELVASRENELSDFLFVLIESDYFFDKGERLKRFSLGMGIAFDGKIYHGRQFSSGEFRSTRWQGERGSQFSLDLEELSLLNNNPEIRSRVFHEIGMNIAFLTNTLNLNHLFIGGDIVPYWQEFRDILLEQIQNNWSYSNQVSCSCNLSSYGEYAAAFGAASMHLERVFAANYASFYQEHGQRTGMDALLLNEE